MSGGIDVSMYRQPAEQPNMLAQLAGLASIRNALTQNDLLTTGLADKRISLLHNELSTLATHPNPTMDDVNGVASRLKANGIPAELVDREVQAIIPHANDPAAIKAIAAQHLAGALDPQGRYNAAYGTPETRNTGGEQRTVFVRPMAGTVTTAGGDAGTLTNTMTPEGASTPTPITDAQGRTTVVTRRQFDARANGRSQLNNGFTGRGAQGGVPATAPGGGIEAPGPNFEIGNKALNEDKQSSAAKIAGTRPLTQAIPIIEGLTNSAAGPGSQALSDLKSRLITMGVIPPGATDVVARQEAQKYLNQYVTKSGIAQRSDMGTVVAKSSSPNLDISLPATLELARSAVAQDRLEAAPPLAFKGKPDDYLDHKARFNQQQDPRAYRLDLMKPADRNALLKDMLAKKDTPEGKRFFNSLNNAHSAIYSAGGDANGQ